MTILLEHYQLPATGRVELDLHRAFEINTTAEQAQRKAHLWLFTEVGNMLRADPPTLAVGVRVVWRVPVVLTAASIGTVGTVGEIDVDVQSGTMDTSLEKVHSMQARAIELGKRLPSYKPRKATSKKYQAETLQPTHSRILANPEMIERISTALTVD